MGRSGTTEGMSIMEKILSAESPVAPAGATAKGDTIIEWLKITAVPLLVFLIGACLWGCIKSIAARRVLTAEGEETARNGAHEGQNSPRSIASGLAAADLEEGLELSQLKTWSREIDPLASAIKAERTLAKSDGSQHCARLRDRGFLPTSKVT